jgi:hypothetical protein
MQIPRRLRTTRFARRHPLRVAFSFAGQCPAQLAPKRSVHRARHATKPPVKFAGCQVHLRVVFSTVRRRLWKCAAGNEHVSDNGIKPTASNPLPVTLDDMQR